MTTAASETARPARVARLAHLAATPRRKSAVAEAAFFPYVATAGFHQNGAVFVVIENHRLNQTVGGCREEKFGFLPSGFAGGFALAIEDHRVALTLHSPTLLRSRVAPRCDSVYVLRGTMPDEVRDRGYANATLERSDDGAGTQRIHLRLFRVDAFDETQRRQAGGAGQRRAPRGVVACVPFNLAHDHVRELAAWLAYHRMLGVSLVRVYDWAPVDVARAKRAAFVRLVAPWVASGALAYHRLYPTGPGKTTGTNNDVEELVANFDCLERSRGVARWIVNPHVDEYYACVTPGCLALGAGAPALPALLRSLPASTMTVGAFEHLSFFRDGAAINRARKGSDALAFFAEIVEQRTAHVPTLSNYRMLDCGGPTPGGGEYRLCGRGGRKTLPRDPAACLATIPAVRPITQPYQHFVRPGACDFWSVFSCNEPADRAAFAVRYLEAARELGLVHLSKPGGSLDHADPPPYLGLDHASLVAAARTPGCFPPKLGAWVQFADLLPPNVTTCARAVLAARGGVPRGCALQLTHAVAAK